MADCGAAGGDGATWEEDEGDPLDDAHHCFFEDCVNAELATEDGVALLADGLSSERVLLRMAQKQLDPRALVVSLGSSELQRSRIRCHLHHRGVVELGSDIPSNERYRKYAQGGLVFVSTRIATVDMLNGVLDCDSIAGLVVLNAHRMREDGNEAFAARLLRSSNRTAFVRALSDKPLWFPRGLNGPELVLQSLGVRQLYLWPRFEKRVEDSLSAGSVTVEEWSPQLGGREKEVQDAIKEAMGLCLGELKRSRHVDTSDLNVEDGLFKTLDANLMAQLEPKWNSIPKPVKQVVSDLKTLRRLAESCLRYDAATFLRFLEAMRVSEPHASFWLLSSAAQKLFQSAKARVFNFYASQPQKQEQRQANEENRKTEDSIDSPCLSSSSPSDEEDNHRKEPTRPSKEAANTTYTTSNDSRIDVVLEPLPKWTALQNAVAECEQDGDGSGGASRIVTIARDGATVNQLQGLMRFGQAVMLQDSWQRYLQTKKDLKEKKQRLPKENTKKNKNTNSKRKRCNHQQQKQTKQHQQKKQWRLAKRGNAGAAHDDDEEQTKAVEVLEEEEALVKEAERERTEPGENPMIEEEHRKKTGKKSADEDGVDHLDENEQYEGDESNLIFRVTAQDGTEEDVLDRIVPTHVVIYDPDLALVREVEAHAARFQRHVKVHFIAYEGSLERDRYIASVKREQHAFADLIHRKSKMSLPELAQASDPSAGSSAAVRNTRRAGGQQLSTEKRLKVIVDLREFMSSLPSTLYAQNVVLNPVTLSIGDYLLSKCVCVERKAVPDLMSSLGSGRLHSQAEEMCKHYSVPCLLIEFEAGKPFCLVPPSDVPKDIVPNSTISKLSLLVLHHPKLRILWSPSMQSTARLFNVLQQDYATSEPEAGPAQQQQSADNADDNEQREETNETAIELLKRLPGVTERNYAGVLGQCESLAELAEQSEESLSQMLGDSRQANRLHSFLHAAFPTTTTT